MTRNTAPTCATHPAVALVCPCCEQARRARSSSPAKAAAARQNGRRGGRPLKALPTLGHGYTLVRLIDDPIYRYEVEAPPGMTFPQGAHSAPAVTLREARRLAHPTALVTCRDPYCTTCRRRSGARRPLED